MNIYELVSKIEEKFPSELAEQWDNVGLLIDRENKEIKKVLLCLDVTFEAINKAINENVDMIISHHPLIFSSIKKILNDDLTGKKILKLIRNDIALASFHTNLDSAQDGLNDYVLNKLNLDGQIFDFELKPLRYLELNKEITLDEISKLIKERLNLENIRICKSNNQNIRKIALTTGAGDSFIKDVLNKVDLFITGDLRHHVSLDSIEQGLNLIDVGHFGSEKFVVDLLSEFLKEYNLEIISDLNSDVFIFC